MARKRRRTTTRSHLPDESPSANQAGAKQTTSINDEIAGERDGDYHLNQKVRKQDREKKRGSTCSDIQTRAPSAQWTGDDNPETQIITQVTGTKRRKSNRVLKKRRRSPEGKGLQSEVLDDDEMMSADTVHTDKRNRSRLVKKEHLEGSVNPRKQLRADPWLWCISRRGLWYLFWHDFRRRRLRSIRFILCRRVNKTTKNVKTTQSNCLENESHVSSGMWDKMGKTTDLRIRSFQRDIITAENENFKDYHKPEETLPSWRPSISIKNDVWVPRRVETNGEGRKRLQWGWGDPLVEVFDIKVDLRWMTKTHGNIHGKIKLDCFGYAVDLFNCNKESSVMIYDKGSLPLKSSDIALLGYEPIAFFVSLKIDDDELCDGHVLWSPSGNCSNEWLLDTVEGENGNVHVTYMVMNQSWLAELEVKLIKSTKETSSKIYGDIVVYIKNIPYLRYFSFSKEFGDYSIVNPLEPIPLSRSLFACHHRSSLVVKVDLWDFETNEPLARGALSFSPEYYGNSVGTVPDPCGIVQVTINWQRYRTHPKTVQVVE